ncbi:hypothetical protein HYS72_01945 [Candidatus Pacearchaeota archaeon]|nr:hypothetical protein [Candidatus Pacearchaeota archaeon]MBI2057103.1 hypothetical protein [Candidatus Pacearchaeota archaeon]
MDAKTGNLHISKDSKRGYIEYDPYVEFSTGEKKHFKHGIMDIRTEIAREAYSSGMLDNPAIKDFLKDK